MKLTKIIHQHWLRAGTLGLCVSLSACAPSQRDQQIKASQGHGVPAPKQAARPPVYKPEKIDYTIQAAARRELDAALASSDPVMRSQGIEACKQTLGLNGKEMFLNGLKDSHVQVKFAACMAIGELRFSECRAGVMELVNDSSPRVRIACRYALHRMGVTQFSKDLEKYAQDVDAHIRADAAMVLGMLNEPTAVRVLQPMLLDKAPSVRLQVAEALWRLGQQQGLNTLVAASVSQYPDDQMVALTGLASPKDRKVMGHIVGALTADHIDVQLVAALCAGRLGSDAGYAVATNGLKSKDPRQRALGALALGAIGRSDAQSTLADCLHDSESQAVRLCAAQALMQLQMSSASAELK